jgi:hypothetical protein
MMSLLERAEWFEGEAKRASLRIDDLLSRGADLDSPEITQLIQHRDQARASAKRHAEEGAR